MKINIGGIIYPSFNSTNGIALEIYLTGCSRCCKNCHNPNLWDKNAGIQMEIDKIVSIINSKKVVDSVAIMGGEPLENKLLLELLHEIQSTGKEIWLYTSYELEEVPDNIKELCNYIKTGEFIEELYCEGRLHSKNQKIFKNENNSFVLYYGYTAEREYA